MSEHQPEEIRRRDNIPESIRTPGKDDAALVIENLIANGKWPMTPSDIAEESDWSRSHMRNVLDQYFERVPAGGGDTEEFEIAAERSGDETDSETVKKMDVDVRPSEGGGVTRTIEIEIPANVTNSIDYMRGYIDGRADSNIHR